MTRAKNYEGLEVKTKYGNTITVLGKTGEVRDKKAEYFFHCDVCSLDKTLFPDGHFKIYRVSNLIKGAVPCNCDGRYFWKEWQYKLRVVRALKVRGLTFKGWAGDFKGNTTKVIIYNDRLDKTTDSKNISQILEGDGCPEEGRLQRIATKTLPDNLMVERFLASGKFLEGTIFGRSDRKTAEGGNRYWNYQCPVCSFDEYVCEGLCSGVFAGVDSDLFKGQRSCRCGNFYWTKEQYEYKISKILGTRGKFLKWKRPNTVNVKSKFLWKCSTCEEDNLVTITKFQSRGLRCQTCRTHKSGFNTNKSGSLYLYRWYGYGEEFYKIGVTNLAVRARVRKQETHSHLDNQPVQSWYFGKGREALEIESEIKRAIPMKACPKNWLPDGYTETFLPTTDNLNTLMVILERHNLTL